MNQQKNNSKKVLVTGANGHLGNNLVKLLAQKGYEVKAGVRNLKNASAFKNFTNIEIVRLDLLDKASVELAVANVDVVFQVGAIFKLWDKNPEKEIYEPNITGTKNIIEACVRNGVKRVVYVSSIASLDNAKIPLSTANGFNPDRSKPYFNAKNDSEQLALQIARQYDLDLVSVLPSAMVGTDCYKLTDSYNILKLVLDRKVFIDTRFKINFIDVKDVAEGCILAAEKGQKWERYILASEKSHSIDDLVKIANDSFYKLNLKLPVRAPKWALMASAGIMEMGSRIFQRAPLIQVSDVKIFYNKPQDCDIAKSRRDLGFSPADSKQAIKKAMIALREGRLVSEEYGNVLSIEKLNAVIPA